MESSQYLEAIQKIPGATPGEKYKALNLIARSVVHTESMKKDASQPEMKRRRIACDQHEQLANVPEILRPLVELEVAKLLQQPEVVVEALKSTDRVLFNRALKVKWFFDGTCEDFTNASYFMDNIMPYISVHRRYSVLKALSKNLASKPHLAEEFYTAVTKVYSEKQAEPLLMACGEFFRLDKLQSLNLYLSPRELNQLMQKNPTSLVNYFKQRGITDYNTDLQFLIRQHSTDFVTFVTSNYYQPISSKRTKALANSRVDLSNLPFNFINSLDLKTLIKKLTKNQFERIIEKKLFPDPNNIENNFSLENFYMLLQYYPEKYDFLVRSFEKFHKSIVDYDKFITPDILLNISPELRVKYARKQQELHQNIWNIKNNDVEKFWRCYLPIKDAIAEIQLRIKISSDAEERCFLLKALIFICQINSDKNCLLSVLEYLAQHHKNEKNSVIVPVLKRLQSSFDLATLTLQYWKYIDIFQDKFPNCVIISKIHLNLIHGISIDSLIDSYMKKTTDAGPWNILIDTPQYERQFLEKICKKIEAMHGNLEKLKKILLSRNIAVALWNFNKRNIKTGIKLMSITNYPLIHSTIKLILLSKNSYHYLKSNLEHGEPDLYRKYYPVKKKSPPELTSMQHVREALKILKKNPHEMIKNWEKYFIHTENIPSRARNHFFTTSLWYQDLPNKFASKCLEDIVAGKKCGKLAAPSLFEGTSIEKAVADSKAFNDNPYWSIILCARNFHLINPQPTPEILLIYYKNDERNAAVFLTKICECMPANKAKECVLEFLKNPKVSINKQCLQIMKKISSNSQVYQLLSTLLKSQQHKSIREFIYTYAKEMLCKYATENWWLLWNECVDIITTNDRGIIKDLIFSKKIPEKFMQNFVKKLFHIYQYLDSIKKSDEIILDDVNFVENYTHNLLYNLALNSQTIFLPDEYHNEILQNYFVNVNKSAKLWKIMEQYAANYVVNYENQIVKTRLQFVTSMILPILKNYWNIPHPNDDNFYPVNSLLNFYKELFRGEVLLQIETGQIIQETLKCLTTVLSPLQMPSCYILLTIKSTITYKKNITEIGQKLFTIISSLIEIYSMEYLHMIAYFFYVTYRDNSENLFTVLEILLNLNNDLVTKFVVTSLEIVSLIEPISTISNELCIKIDKALSNCGNPAVMYRMNLIIDKVRMHDGNID